MPEEIKVMSYFYKIGDMDVNSFAFLCTQFKSNCIFKLKMDVKKK